MKGRLRLAKKMARSSSLSPVERFLMNCTYLDQRTKSRAVHTPFRTKSPVMMLRTNTGRAFEQVQRR